MRDGAERTSLGGERGGEGRDMQCVDGLGRRERRRERDREEGGDTTPPPSWSEAGASLAARPAPHSSRILAPAPAAAVRTLCSYSALVLVDPLLLGTLLLLLLVLPTRTESG